MAKTKCPSCGMPLRVRHCGGNCLSHRDRTRISRCPRCRRSPYNSLVH